jgi:hypothetical protein
VSQFFDPDLNEMHATPSCANCRHSRWSPDAGQLRCTLEHFVYLRPIQFGELQRNSEHEREALTEQARACRDYQEEL